MSKIDDRYRRFFSRADDVKAAAAVAVYAMRYNVARRNVNGRHLASENQFQGY